MSPPGRARARRQWHVLAKGSLVLEGPGRAELPWAFQRQLQLDVTLCMEKELL